MGYCTNAELTLITGTTLSTAIQDAIIDQADREIKSRLALAEISAPSADDKLKSASLNLGIAGVLTRMRLDGSKPASFTIGDISAGDDIDKAISELQTKAWAAVDSYILTHGTSGRYRFSIRKVN